MVSTADWFIDMFTAEAERLIENLAKEKRVASLPEAYWWIPGLPKPALTDKTVVAVDGGGGIQPLAGGGSIYIARAYVYRGSLEPIRGLELKYYPVRDTKILDALRTWLEHRTALAAVTRLEEGSILLMDGSLWAVVTASLASIVKLAVREPGGLAAVYTGFISLYTLTALVELVKATRDRGILIAWVSKDHSYSALKELVLLKTAAEAWKPLEPLVQRALNWYPLAERSELLRARRAAPPEVRSLLEIVLDLSYRDQHFIDDSVGVSQGYSKPMTLPPPQRLGMIVLRYGVRRIVETVCQRVSDYLGEREADECWDNSRRFTASLDTLPSTLLTYVRLGLGDKPLLVEIPFTSTTYFGCTREFYEPDERLETILSILVRDYGGPDYYNIPLIAAHMSATLKRQQLENYIKLLESLAAAHGVKLSVARSTALSRRLKRPRGSLSQQHRL